MQVKSNRDARKVLEAIDAFVQWRLDKVYPKGLVVRQKGKRQRYKVIGWYVWDVMFEGKNLDKQRTDKALLSFFLKDVKISYSVRLKKIDKLGRANGKEKAIADSCMPREFELVL